MKVLDGGQVGPTDLLCRPYSPLKSVPVLFGGRSKPNRDGNAENRLDDGGGEDDQQLPRQLELPQLLQNVQALLGLLPDRVYVGGPLQVPGACGSQDVERVHTRHGSVEDPEGGQGGQLPPEIHRHLHSLGWIQLQLVLTTSDDRLIHLVPVGGLLAVLDEDDERCVVCKL